MGSKNYFWHEKTWIQFFNAYSQNHLPHAILLSGPRGVGKLEFSERLVKFLLCEKPQFGNQQACGKCQGCKTYASGANPDFLNIQVLEDKQQISVDQIRQLSEFLNYSRSFDAYRVVLLHPAERMNKNAANSLLKSLEEPASNTVIILTATHLSHILPTIKSRSQLLTLSLPNRQQAMNWIRQEKPDLGNLEELLEISYGSPLIAIQVQNDILEKRNALAKDILDIVDKNFSVTEVAKKWEKFDLELMLNWQVIWLQHFIKKLSLPDANTSLFQIYSDTLQKLEKELKKEQVWRIYHHLLVKKQTVHTSVNTLMNIEDMLGLWLQASPIKLEN